MKVYEAKVGFEAEFDSLVGKKDALAAEKEAAYAEAKAKVDAEFAEREDIINQLLTLITNEVETEVASEVEAEAVTEPVQEAEAEDVGSQVEAQPVVEENVQEQPVQPGQAFSPFTRI